MDIRTMQVVRACKIITDLLPFDRKNHALIEESELMKYLLLSLPLNPRAIDMIINSMINKFKKLHYFLKELWFGFTAIAQLEEPAGTLAVQKSETGIRMFQNNVKKVLKLLTLKDLDYVSNTSSSRVSEYCDIITQNKGRIKLSVLNYVDKVIDIYLKELKNSVAFKPDIAELLKKFITFSQNDKVIMRVCTIIEKVSVLERDSTLNHEIEQLVVTKKAAAMENKMYGFGRRTSIDEELKSKKNEAKKGVPSYKEVGSPITPKIENTFRRKTGETSPNKNLSPLATPRKKKSSETNKEILKEIHAENLREESLNENVGLFTDTAEVAIEKWLAEGDSEETPIILKNQLMYNLFKNPGNLEILLSFIFDPQLFPIGECWKDKCPPVPDDLDESFVEPNGTPTPSLRFQKLKEDTFLYPFVVRSFRTMQVLSDPKNIKYIAQMNSRTLENYFSFMYACLNHKDDIACNFSHIAKVTEFLLLKEPEICVNYLVYYNLLYRFILNIEFPTMPLFFLTLFNSSYNEGQISTEAYKKIMKYCEIVSFFSDLASGVLLGPKGIDIIKCEAVYKPPGIESLINGAITTNELEGLFDENPIFGRRDHDNPLLENELNGNNLDIDDLHAILFSGKKFNKKKVQLSKIFLQKTLSLNIIKKYASLREKYHYEERLLTERNMDADRSDNLEYKESHRSHHVQETSRKDSELMQRQKTAYDWGSRKNSSGIIIKKKTSTEQMLGLIVQNPTGLNVMSPKNLNHSPLSKQLSQLSRPGTRQLDGLSKMNETTRDVFYQSSNTLKIDAIHSKEGRAVTEVSEDYESTAFLQAKNSNIVSQLNIDSKKQTQHSAFFSPPEKITLAQEFISDVMTTEEAEKLNSLYPITNSSRIESEIDKEAKKPEFTLSNIRKNESFSIELCNLFESLFRKALSSPYVAVDGESKFEKVKEEDKVKKVKIQIKQKLGHLDVDYTPFWNAIFHADSKVFESLLRNYLLKIKIHHLEETNSGYIAGQIVNMILSKCGTHPNLKNFFTKIHNTCREHTKFLCKVIIQSHAWPKKDNKIYLQSKEVKEPLGTGRILLVETLYWILKNDQTNNFRIIYEINDTCWHTLITWFSTKRTNNIYHRLFYSILEMTFNRCGEKFILNLFFKLDLLTNMHKIWGETYQNNVLVKENYSESMINCLKKITLLVDSIILKYEKYVTLRNQLTTSISWTFLKSKLVPKVEKKKEPQSVRDSRRSSKISTREFLNFNSPPSRQGARNVVIAQTPNIKNYKKESILKSTPISSALIKE